MTTGLNSDLYREIVWTEYMLEHDLSRHQMLEREHVEAMQKRVAHMEWQDEQRAVWMGGSTPEFVVPDDCPF